jgi:hypothetical protein
MPNIYVPSILKFLHFHHSNKTTSEHNKNIFDKTIGPIFYFQAKYITHDICPPNFTLSKIDPSKIDELHNELHLKQNILIELCACNSCTNVGLANGDEGFFKIAIKSNLTFEI